MGATNYSYEHRCIVVDNADFEIGNVPEYGKENISSFRNYPSYKLLEYEDDFYFIDIVLTMGYNTGACIDYIKKDIDLYDTIGCDPWKYESVKEFVDDLTYYFKAATKTAVKKIFTGYRASGLELGEFLSEKTRVLRTFVLERELKEADKIVSKIKSEYGYSGY